MEDPNTEISGENTAAEQSVPEENGKSKRSGPSLFKKLISKLFKYKLKFSFIKRGRTKKSNETEEAEKSSGSSRVPGAETEGQSDEPQKEKKKKKEKKEKKPKPPKEKKPKAPKPAKKAASNDESGEEKPKKNMMGFVIGLVIGLIGASAVGAGIYFVFGPSPPTPQERLDRAAELIELKRRPEAEEIYQELIQNQADLELSFVTQAYLSLADMYISDDRLEDAMLALESGFGFTDDPAIKNKLDEITPKPPPVSNAQSAPVDEIVLFSDSAFERMVRIAISLPEPEPIRQSHLKNITTLKIVGETHAAVNKNMYTFVQNAQGYMIDNVTYTERGGITSIKDAVNFPNLRKLVVCHNQLSDLSGIEDLSTIETLGLYFNDIVDLEPVSKLAELRNLYIYGNRIESLAPLSGLKELTELYAQHNQISDLTPLSGLTKLRELFLSDNQISDISSLEKLDSLAYLYAVDNNISDISVVARLGSLTDISFLGNPVADMSPAALVKYVNREEPLRSNTW